MRDIAAELATRGYVSKSGAPFGASVVRRMLKVPKTDVARAIEAQG